MVQFAREAGCSVGALYARYPEKTTYLYRVIGAGFRSLREDADTKLSAKLGGREAATAAVPWVVRSIVDTMTNRKAAGIIRASIKLSTVKPDTIEFFEDYRKAVADQAVALLAPKLPNTSTQAIRIAVQIMMATITDAVLQKRPGPIHAGTPRMVQALTNIMLGYLDLEGTSEDDQNGDDEDNISSEDELTDEPPTDGSPPIVDPEFRRYIRKRTTGPNEPASTKPTTPPPLPSRGKGSVTSPAAGQKQAGKPQPASPVAPKAVKPGKLPPPEPEPLRPKRRHRWI